MKNSISIDQSLGQCDIGRLLFRLALPAVISQLVNMLYNIVDRMYIGSIPNIGVTALTGLGLCFPIIMIVSAFSSLFGIGGAPKAAIEMGKGNYEKAEHILGNCFTALLIASIILMSGMLLFGEELLYLFGASGETVGYALDYLNIYALGTIFVQIALGLNVFIATQGFAKYSMITVVMGAVINILLDPIFIFVFGMGVQGAAFATMIAQMVSAIWVLRFLVGKKTRLKIKWKNMKLKKEIICSAMILGVSPFIMQSTESILNICFNVSLQKYGGDLAVGAMTIAGSVMTVFGMPMQGVTQGAQPIISFNYGAGNYERVKKTIQLELTICGVLAFLFWMLIMLFPKIFISIFSSDTVILEMTTWCIRVYMAGVFLAGIQIGCQQTFIALGYAKHSLLLACLRKIVLLIPLIFVLPNFLKNKVFAVFLAEPIADIISALVIMSVFFRVVNKQLTCKMHKNSL